VDRPLTMAQTSATAPPTRLLAGALSVLAGGLCWSFTGVFVRLAPHLDSWQFLVFRGLGVAVSLDDGPLQVVNVFTQETTKDETNLGRKFQQNTENNARVMHITQTVEVPGKHTLKITMVDPTVVVQSVIVYDAPLPQSYFGPPPTRPNGGVR